MKTKKLWSAILAFALVVSSTASGAWNSSTAKAAETKAKVLAYVAVENDAATGSAIKIDKTPVLLDEGSTALDALQQEEDPQYKALRQIQPHIEYVHVIRDIK